MNLTSRIFTYLVGIGIGSLLVYLMLFRGRSDRKLGGWLPNERVISKIIENPLHSTREGACYLDCLGINESALKETYLEGANVAFGKSETSAKPCPVYLINTTVKDFPVEMFIEVCDSVSTIRIAKAEGLNCDC